MFNIFIPKMASDGDGGIWRNQDNLIPTTQKLGSKYRYFEIKDYLSYQRPLQKKIEYCKTIFHTF